VLLYTVADHQLHPAELRMAAGTNQHKECSRLPAELLDAVRNCLLLLLLLLLRTCVDSSELWQSFSRLLRRSEAGHPAAKHSASSKLDLPEPLGPVMPTS
jgi:hypothetical protein